MKLNDSILSTNLSAIIKRARIELKTTDEDKELLTLAAKLDGTDLTSFILSAAMDKARIVLSEHNSILLSRKGQEALSSLLKSPPSNPTQAMNELMSLPKLKKT